MRNATPETETDNPRKRQPGWRRFLPAAPVLLLALAACTETGTGSGEGSGYLANVPEEVLALAAPDQNLNAVRFNEEDGCYWYLHEGPVEATMLPLRTAAGNPICVKREEG